MQKTKTARGERNMSKNKKNRIIQNPYKSNLILYSVVSGITLILYLLARFNVLSFTNFPNLYLILLCTFGYASLNAYTQYRDFERYRKLYPGKVQDRKSYEAFVKKARAEEDAGERLGR